MIAERCGKRLRPCLIWVKIKPPEWDCAFNWLAHRASIREELALRLRLPLGRVVHVGQELARRIFRPVAAAGWKNSERSRSKRYACQSPEFDESLVGHILFPSIGIPVNPPPGRCACLRRTRAVAELPVDRWYRVAGLVLLRQRPSSAKGVTFVTLEDETGTANLIIRQEIWDRYRRVARNASAMVAHGHLQRESNVIHILVQKLEDLSSLIAAIGSQSRDFR